MTPRRPDTGDQKLLITFRSDLQRTYTAKQLRWGDTGHAFDVVAYEVAK